MNIFSQKKILVIQVKIGNKDFHNRNDLNKYFEFEENVCRPSVISWSKRCGYDYKLITESSIENNNFFKTVQHKYAAERLMHLYHEDYDYIIYIDTDVYVSKNSPKFPINFGLTGVPRYVSQDEWKQLFPNIKYSNQQYINSGVFCVDKETGKTIFKYFLDRLESGDNSNITYADQDILNAWQFKNGCNIIGQKWNYLLLHNHMLNVSNCFDIKSKEMLEQNYDLLKESNFIHFVGHSKLIYNFFFRKIFK